MSLVGLSLIVLTAAMTMAANLLIRNAIERAAGFGVADGPGIVANFARLLLDPVFVVGFAGYFAASLVWFKVLASEPLSVAYPVLVGLTFALVTGGAVLVLGEPLSSRKLLGLALILGGIAIVSMEPAG